MKRRLRSQCDFKQYKPYVSRWRRFVNFLKKNKSQPVLTMPGSAGDLLRNPFRRAVAKKKTAWRKWLFAVVFIATLLAWAVLLWYSPYFKINKVNYSGLKVIGRGEIDNFVQENYLNKEKFFGLMPRGSYFSTNVLDIERGLREKYSLNSLSVKKVFPRTLNVDLEEKISSLIYDNGRKYFLLDIEGNVIKHLGDVAAGEYSVVITSTTANPNTTSSVHTPNYKKYGQDFPGYPLLYDARAREVAENGKEILPPTLIGFVLQLSETLQKQGIGRLYYFEMENPAGGVVARLDRPKQVLFTAEDDLTTQMNNLKTILRESKPKEYIDLRYGEKIFWK